MRRCGFVNGLSACMVGDTEAVHGMGERSVQATFGQRLTLSERAYAMSQFVSNRHRRVSSTPKENASDTNATGDSRPSSIGEKE